MARKIIIGEILNLIKGLGGNPNKFMGTRSNINFLGKGPKETLFQGQLDIDGMVRSGFPLESVISEAESAGGYMTAGKLNDLQLQRLKDNLIQLKQAYKPEPIANITDMATGTGDLTPGGLEYLKRTGKTGATQTTKNMESIGPGYLPEPGTAGVTAMLDQKTGMSRAIARQILQQDTRLNLPEEVLVSLRTGSKGADPLDLMRKYYGDSMLKYDDFLNQINPEAASPTEFAEMVLKHVKLTPQFAEGGLVDILSMNDGGRAGFKYGSRAIGKGVLAILNRNKKNADYMFKASDNVSPGYAQGDMKYNAELLAEQLAEDAGVVYDDLADLDRIKFYGTAYDYLAKEMGMMKKIMGRSKSIIPKNEAADWKTDFNEEILGETVKRVRPRQSLKQWNPPNREMIREKYQGLIDDKLLNKILADNDPQRIAEVLATIDEALLMQGKGMNPESIIQSFRDTWGRKKNASGGLAKILEV